MSIDDLDFLLNDANAALEAKFRELEAAEGIDDFKERPDMRVSATKDPLQALKEQLDSTSTESPRPATQRYVLLTCPSCKAKNRTALEKLRRMEPNCGGCSENLTFDYPKG